MLIPSPYIMSGSLHPTLRMLTYPITFFPCVFYFFIFIFNFGDLSLLLLINIARDLSFFFFFLPALGLRCCVQAFSSCGEQGLLFVAVRGLRIAVASLCCGAWTLGAQASVVVARGL